MKLFILGAFVMLSHTVFSQSISETQKQSIDSVFQNWNSIDRPGLAVGIVKDGNVVYSKTFGLADVSSNRKIDENTSFWIASVSKQFTALGITLLEKKGAISVEDRISKYLPELSHLPAIQIKDLLHHTSGLRDGYTLVGMTLRGEKHYDAASVFEMLKKQKSLNFPPGSRYEYINSNYVLLAIIIERVSKKSYADFMREDLFSTLRMPNARVHDSDTKTNDAIGYNMSKGKYKPVKRFLPAIGSTGVMMSLNDGLQFEKSLYNGGTLSFQDLLLADGFDSAIHYKRGVENYQFRGMTVVTHFGSDPGFRADILRLPSKNLSVIIFSNAGDYWDLVKNMFDAAGIALQEPSLQSRWLGDNNLRTSASNVIEFEGVYLDTISGSSTRFIKYQDGVLRASSTLHGYYASLKHVEGKKFRKQDTYEFDYNFASSKLDINRADGHYTYMKIDSSTFTKGIPISKIKGKYYSDELGKNYQITKKGNTLRLSFFRLLHAELKPLGGNKYYTEFAGGNVLEFREQRDGKLVLFFNREGIKNLQFRKK